MAFQKDNQLSKRKIPWNKGLTKEIDIRVRKSSMKMAKSKKGVPATIQQLECLKLGRYKGWKHTENTKRKISKSKKKNPTRYWLGKKRSEATIRKMRIFRSKQIFPIKDSSIEVKVQTFLKLLGIPFFTHQYMKINHAYQCDILIPSMNLIIECDGDYWHKYPVGREIDNIRTEELIERGFKVLRLWEHEINDMDVNSFKNKIGC